MASLNNKTGFIDGKLLLETFASHSVIYKVDLISGRVIEDYISEIRLAWLGYSQDILGQIVATEDMPEEEFDNESDQFAFFTTKEEAEKWSDENEKGYLEDQIRKLSIDIKQNIITAKYSSDKLDSLVEKYEDMFKQPVDERFLPHRRVN